jgi:hypothetical protein
MAELMAEIGSRGILDGPPVSALYPSAGPDTKQFTFTHPEFFARRGLAEVPDPNVYVLVDVNAQPPPAFTDAATELATTDAELLTVGGVEMQLLTVRHHSDTFADRTIAVVSVTIDNREIQPIWHREDFVPDVFIGVNDGCRWGGNPKEFCVNRLNVPPGMPQAVADAIRVPRWWIADHFMDIQAFVELGVGGLIRSSDARFPFAYRKVALLSSDWGKYAGPAMAGATLFETVRCNEPS